MTTLESIEQKLAGITLKRGDHKSPEAGMCAMELVAYVAGEEHSDHPECACPVITAFVIRWNDDLPDDAARDRWIKPFVPLLINSRVLTPDGEMDTDVLVTRAYLCADAACRQFAPLALEAAGMALSAAGLLDHAAEMAKRAQRLRSIEPVTAESARAAVGAARAARAARDAAGDALDARAAVGAAQAAEAAARAARDAAGAARDQINEIRVALVRALLTVNGATRKELTND